MRKLVVTGAGGFLGRVVCRELRDEFEITGLYCSHRPDVGSFWATRVDITDFRETSRYLKAERPDYVIHLAAISNIGQCEKDPQYSRRVNVEATAELASLCADLGTAFLFASSDLVFDGLHAPYAEDAPPAPTTLYGEQKAEAEREVTARHPGSKVCRLALLYGPPTPYAPNYFAAMLQNLREGKDVPLFTDEYRTPLSCRDAARGLRLVLDASPGVYHVGGADRLSRLDFGQLAAEVLGLPRDTIRPCLRSSVSGGERRPPDLALDIAKVRGIGFAPGAVRHELEALIPEVNRAG